MASVNALPFLDSSSASWDLALDRLFTENVVEAYQPAVILFNNEYPGVLKMNDDQGYQGQFIQRAPAPEPDDSYTPGTRLEGQQYGAREDFIQLDSPLVVHKWFRADHVAVSRFPMMESEFVSMGQALARKLDKRGFITLAKAARANSAVYDANGSSGGLVIHNGGNRVTRQNGTGTMNAYPVSSTGAANFRLDMDALCFQFDSNNVPREGRIAYCTPFILQVARQDTGIFDVQYAQMQSANNLQMGVIGEISGFKIVMANDRIPSGNITSTYNWVTNAYTGSGSSVTQTGTNQTSATGTPSKYQGNFSYGAKASAGQPVVLAVGGIRQGSAPVGYRQVGAIKLDRQWYPEYQSWFASASVLGGFGQMHQYTAGSIEVTSD